MRQLIAGNWKMHGRLTSAASIVTPLREASHSLAQNCDLLICPPATLLHAVSHMLVGSPVAVGGQDCHSDAEGPHTGDIAASMLRDAGATWVILGHSERRASYGETDDLVRRKVLAARSSGLMPLVCVGETAEQRTGGMENETVGWQIEGSLPKDFSGVLAYEPVWAIGTGRVATPDEIGAMHSFIREELIRQLGPAGEAIRILYGGSVRATNCKDLFGLPEVSGALVGGASLDPHEFLAIARGACGG